MVENVSREECKKELLLKFTYLVLVFVLCLQIISNYIFYVTQVIYPGDKKDSYEIVISYVMSFMILLHILLIIYNTKINFKYRNLRIESPIEKPLIFYLLCMPLIIITIIGLILIVVLDSVVWLPLKLDDGLYCVLFTIEFFMILTLILNISGYKDTGEEWFMNYINVLTISFTIVSLIMQSAYNLIRKQTDSFTSASQYFLNIPRNNNSNNNEPIFEQDIIDGVLNSKTNAIMMLLIVFTPYLWISLKRNWSHIIKDRLAIPYELNNINNRFGSLFSLNGVLISGVFSLGLIILMIFKLCNFDLQSDSNILVNNTIDIIINIVIIFVSFFMISGIRNWPRLPYHNYMQLRHILVYVGAFGKLLVSLNNSLIDIYFLMKNDHLKYLQYSFLPLNICEIVEVILVSTLVSMLIERKPILFDQKSLNLFICSPVMLLMFNVYQFVSQLISITVPFMDKDFEIRLMSSGISLIGKPFMLLFNGLSFVILGSTLIQMINK